MWLRFLRATDTLLLCYLGDFGHRYFLFPRRQYNREIKHLDVLPRRFHRPYLLGGEEHIKLVRGFCKLKPCLVSIVADLQDCSLHFCRGNHLICKCAVFVTLIEWILASFKRVPIRRYLQLVFAPYLLACLEIHDIEHTFNATHEVYRPCVAVLLVKDGDFGGDNLWLRLIAPRNKRLHAD